MTWFGKHNVHEFSDLATKGRGLMVGNKRFVHHSNLELENSAAVSITLKQKLVMLISCILVLALLLVSYKTVVFALVCVLTVFYFVDLLFGLFLAHRSFSRNPEIQVSAEELDALVENDLPTYTVFCPLYKEWQVLPQFVEAMQALDYPKDKLQVMLQLEEDDAETVQRAQNMQLPKYFEIVVVPNSKPKTKPKAMNYGLQFATGDIVTIYDAEDKPESLQLKKVVVAFRKLPENVVCVQGKLNFYNPHQNMLTRMFTAEYSLWFDLILPGLQSIGAPIPLGGTSNNFKKSILHEIYGWDAYNVTEDCDLGMRLSKRGYKTAIVDSTTLEEANSNYHNWYRQRSRWIKGYMQTYLVHMRSPMKSVKEFGLRNFLLLQLTIGGKVLSMFINPLLWVITISYFAARTVVAPIIEPFFPPAVLYIGVVSLIFGNFFYIYAYLIGLAKRKEFRVMKFVFLVPLYWLGMSVAAWKALYELFVKPHYWQKTNHGLHLAKDEIEKLKVESEKQKTELILNPELQATPAMLDQAPSLKHQASELLISESIQTTDYKPQTSASVLSSSLKLGASSSFSIRAYVTAKYLELRSSKVAMEGAWLVVASAGANFFNFLLNAFLGRKLTLTDFGVVTLFSTIISLSAVVFGAISSTVTHIVAFLLGQKRVTEGVAFNKKTVRYVFLWSMLACLVWVLGDDYIANFFQVSDITLIWFFSPTLLFGALASVQYGFLKGRFSFKALGIATLVEAISKLVFAMAFVWSGRTDLVAVSIPASIAVSFLVLDYYAEKMLDAKAVENDAEKTNTKVPAFPYSFFGASMLSGVAATLFLNIDVLVAKHTLSPEAAGAYALLSLVGKMIFLFGSLLTTFINSVVSHHDGAKTDPHTAFSKIFRLTLFASSLAFLGVGPLGRWTVPLLFGDKSNIIVPYLNAYGLAMVAFTLSCALVGYRVARKQYSFAWVQVFGSLATLLALLIYNDSIGTLTLVVFVGAVGTLFLIVLWRAVVINSRFVLRNLVDLFDLFVPFSTFTPLSSKLEQNAKRILVFNWRDTTHAFAGGAESYIHELAKRWVLAGHSVTQFSGNDSTQLREEVVDGVHVVRRGGFYFVYVWAFLYYMFRFRGKYDIIIDCQNGIPFFTPFYAREQVYCLLHHVHQEVFHKFLSRPLALFAACLEKDLMPYVYRDTKFITVSNSSKKEMEDLGLGLAGIEVVFPGVDLEVLEPGEKSAEPSILYLGRLKAYKSVDVLVRAFEKVRNKLPNAKLIIAGGGEEEHSLRELVRERKLSHAVKFKGKVTDAEKLSLLQQAWVFVNPSMMEGWGITTIEANACGVPVVASNVPGLRESVQNPHTGYLVPYGDEDALAKRITELLEQPELREAMGRNALIWAKNFDWELSTRKTLTLILKAE